MSHNYFLKGQQFVQSILEFGTPFGYASIPQIIPKYGTPMHDEKRLRNKNKTMDIDLRSKNLLDITKRHLLINPEITSKNQSSPPPPTLLSPIPTPKRLLSGDPQPISYPKSTPKRMVLRDSQTKMLIK